MGRRLRQATPYFKHTKSPKSMLTRYVVLCFALFICFNAKSQFTIDHLYESTRTYNPIFGNEASAISISLELGYSEHTDSIMALVIAINQNKLKVAGTNVSIGGGFYGGSSWGLLSGLVGSLSINKHYTFMSSQGLASLNEITYDSILIALAKIKEISSKKLVYSKTIMFKINKLAIGVDIKVKRSDNKVTNDKTYYFQIDESVFKLSDSEFTDLCDNIMEPLQTSFKNFRESRTIAIPVAN